MFEKLPQSIKMHAQRKLDEACALWGQPAEAYQYVDHMEDDRLVNSARAGGWYVIRARSTIQLRQLPLEQRALLCTWILDQNRAGQVPAELSSENVAAALSRRTMSATRKVERLLLLLASSGYRPGKAIDVYQTGTASAESERARARAAAWIEATDDREVFGLRTMLVASGVLTQIENGNCYLSEEGFRRMEALEDGGAVTDQAFVAMWFGPEMNDAYEHGIAPGIEDAGYRPVRIDRKEHANKIDDEIIAEIRRSRFVVADFTCGSLDAGDGPIGIPRGGVYYEAGFAMGLRIPVIWTVRADQIGLVHFDTRQYAHITWSTHEELRTALYRRIGATIGERLRAP